MDHLSVENWTPDAITDAHSSDVQKLVQCQEKESPEKQLCEGESRMPDIAKLFSSPITSEPIVYHHTQYPDLPIPTTQMPHEVETETSKSQFNDPDQYTNPIEQTKPLVFSRKRVEGESSNSEELPGDGQQLLDGTERKASSYSESQISTRRPLLELEPSYDDYKNPGEHSQPHVHTDEETTARLMAAIERLRSERDDLQRQLEFTMMESQFAIDNLEKKLLHIATSENEMRLLETNAPKLCDIPPTNTVQEVGIMTDQPMEDIVQDHTIVHVKELEEVTARPLESQIAFICAGRLLNWTTVFPRDVESLLEEARHHHSPVIALQILSEEVQTEPRIALLAVKATPTDNDEIELSGKDGGSDAQTVVIRLQRLLETTAFSPLRLPHSDYSDRVNQAQLRIAISGITSHNATPETSFADDTLSRILLPNRPETDQPLTDSHETEPPFCFSAFQQSVKAGQEDLRPSLRSDLEKENEELRDRILRRTEQIGMHQHDIKRLETNLQLAEDRITELISELETAGMEKEAMLEDCMTAREERDDVKKRVEQLEIEVDSLTQTLRKKDEEEAILRTLVREKEDALMHAGNQFRESNDNLTAQQTKLTEEITTLRAQLCSSEASYRRAIEELRLEESSSRKLQQELATAQDEHNRVLATLEETKRDLEAHLRMVELSGASTTDLEKRVGDLEKDLNGRTLEVDTLNAKTTKMECAHNEEFTTLKERLNAAYEDARILTSQKESAADEMKKQIKEANDNWASALHHVEQQKNEIGDLQKHIEVLLHDTANVRQAVEKVENEKAEITAALERMDDDRQHISFHKKKIEDELLAAKEQHANDIMNIRRDLEAQCDGLKEQLLKSEMQVEDMDTRLRQADERLSDTKRQLEMQNMHASDLQQQLQALQEERGDLRQKTETLCSERDHLQVKLEQLEEGQRAFDLHVQRLQKEYDTMLLRHDGEIAQMQEELDLARGDAESRQAQLQQSEMALQDTVDSLTEAKSKLIKTENQLEVQQKKVIEVELQMQALEQESERICQDLETVDRERADMQNVLQDLELANQQLHEDYAAAQAQYREMDALLATKCTEIEENDDKIITLLKDKKKLSSKVEALTRKLQSVRTKPIDSQGEPSSTTYTNTQAGTATAYAATYISPPDPVFTAEPSRPRVFEPESRLREKSGLSRSKATDFAVHSNGLVTLTSDPPLDLPHAPVKSRKSNLRTLPENEIRGIPISSGTKRRTPDDVEPEISLPPQIKVAEQASNRRRPLQALRQGFTPHRRRSKSSSDSPLDARAGSLII